MKVQQPIIEFFQGPNIYFTHKVIIASYNSEDYNNGPTLKGDILGRLNPLLPEFLFNKIQLENVDTADELIMRLLDLMLNANAPTVLSCKLRTEKNGDKKIVIHPLNEVVVINAVRITFLIVSYVLSADKVPAANFVRRVETDLRQLLQMSPGPTISEMQSTADRFNIPFYIIDYNTLLTLYGQGKNGRFYDYSCGEDNSFIGYKLQSDKSFTNNLLSSLGYPATEQHIVSNFETCQLVTKKMGYPVVIKPPRGGMGNGITANIRNDRKLKMAFDKASNFANGPVIIEKHIEGDDHRLSVSDGKISGFAKKITAHVVGDGKSTIEQLIKKENRRREKVDNPLLYFVLIKIDDDLLRVLDYDGYELGTIPAENEIIYLRDLANISLGAFPEILTEDDVHPDNIKMMLDVVKSFRLGSVGIDFITPDISKSWRECGKIIEINASAGLSHRLAKALFETTFYGNNYGRIDTALVVTNDNSYSKKRFDDKKSTYQCPAFSNSSTTLIDGEEKAPATDNLYERCKSVLLNPDCDFLMVAMSEDEIIENGLPLDRFDQVIIDDNSSIKNQRLKNLFHQTTGLNQMRDWLEKVSST